METLRSIYYAPETGFISQVKLYAKAKAQDPTITHKLVKQFLSQQEVAQVHQQRRKSSQYPLTAFQAFQRLQIDLQDMSNENPPANGGHRFIFNAIDVYSRYALSFPQKNKTDQECLRNFKQAIAAIEALGYSAPTQVDSDNESGFTSRIFTDYCASKHITQNFCQPGDHARLGVVDRFTRTLRGLLERYQTATHSQKWAAVLPQLIQNYNSTLHTTLKQTPEQAVSMGGVTASYLNRKTTAAAAVSYNRTDFQPGDRVRLLIKKGLFDKGSTRWTKSIHTITAFEDGLYHVSDRATGYRKAELQKIGATVESAPAPPEPDDLENASKSKYWSVALLVGSTRRAYLSTEHHPRRMRRRPNEPFVVGREIWDPISPHRLEYHRLIPAYRSLHSF